MSPGHENATPDALLREVFGFGSFRGEQQRIIEHLIAGGDALVLMPTGGGKSICYQIPALSRAGTGLVISPLIALMQDQVNALSQLGIEAAFLNSSLEPDQQRAVEADLVAGRLDLLYVAPERLVRPDFLDLLARARIALFAIDEAHCVSQWGHDFRPEYQQLAVLHERFPEVPRMACTATADEPTRKDIVEQLDLARAHRFVSGFNRPNIRYTVVPKQSGRQQLGRFLAERHPGAAGIVYCRTRKRVEDTAAWLEDQGVNAVAYHAGLPQSERRARLAAFQREEGLVVVATIAFGMGIDKPDVRFVAHLDVPKSLEAYYQESGRAGRDGEPADAWMAYGLADVVQLRQLMDRSEAEERHKWLERRKLEALLGYCETASCRRAVMLRYFGEEIEDRCGNCDTCLHPVETWDGTVAAQKALSCAYRTGQRFGAAYLADVLLGSDNERIQRFGHDRLPTFGVGTDLTRRQWLSVIRQLVAGGFLDVAAEYGSLRLTEAARPVLRGELQVDLRHEPAAPSRPSKAKRAPVELSSPADELLFEALRAKRLEIAREQDVPPYVVFHDSTLREMAVARPTSLAAMDRISGVGAAKLERYGEIFLTVIREDTESAV